MLSGRCTNAIALCRRPSPRTGTSPIQASCGTTFHFSFSATDSFFSIALPAAVWLRAPVDGHAHSFYGAVPLHIGLGLKLLICSARCRANLEVTQMSQRKPTRMTREAVSRIMSKESKTNGGKTPPNSFSTRADSTLQKQEAAAKRKA